MKTEDEDPHGSPEAQRALREERAAQYRELRQLSIPNRLRLMFGLAPIPEPSDGSDWSDESDHSLKL